MTFDRRFKKYPHYYCTLRDISFIAFLFAPLDEVFVCMNKCDDVIRLWHFFAAMKNLIVYLAIAKIIMLTIFGPISSLFLIKINAVYLTEWNIIENYKCPNCKEIKYNNAKRSIPAHPTFVNDSHHDLHLWPVTSKINRVHPLPIVNMSAKFDEEAQNGLVSIVLTRLLPYMSIVTLTSDLQNNRVHPLTIAKMSARFDKEEHNGLVSIMLIITSLFTYMSTFDLQNRFPWLTCLPSLMKKYTNLLPYMSFVNLNFDLLTPKSLSFYSLTMVNLPAKFNEEAHNGLVSIMITSLFRYMSIVTLTFDHWPPNQ